MEAIAKSGASYRQAWQWRLWLQGLVGARYDGLRHFHIVQPGVLMRCGQPRVRDLEEIRRKHGLKTIVVARGGTRHPLRGRWFRKERAFCERTGIRLEHMPFSDAKLPPEDVFERFLEILADEGNYPVLVHCEQGFHRTGILCAAYRVRACAWDLARAMAELEANGFEMGREKRRPLVEALRSWAKRAAAPERRLDPPPAPPYKGGEEE